MSEPICSVVPIGRETTQYGCGHIGPAKWNLNLFGRIVEVPAEVMNDGRCGQCHADEFIQCPHCHEPIGPGENCITYSDHEGIHCLGEHCGPGPKVGNPGKWDGKTFHSDFVTGRGMGTLPRC